jgi:branched-chain amino acid transport system substrate-binding protein
MNTARSRTRTAVALATVAVVGLGLTACSSSSGGGKTSSTDGTGSGSKSVTIGFSTPETGPLAAYGPVTDGAIARLKAQNAAGGVDGYTFNIVEVDNQGTVQGGASSMRQLLAKDPLAIQISTTPALTGAANLLKSSKNDTPTFGVANGAVIKQMNLPNLVGLVTNYDVEAKYVINYAVTTLGLKKIAVLHNSATESTASVAPDYTKSIGGDLVTDISIPSDAVNMTPYVLAAQKAGAQAVIALISAGMAGNYLKAAKSQGYDVPVLGYLSNFDPSVVSVAGDAAEQFYADSPYPPLASDEPAVKQFLSEVQQYAPHANTIFGMAGWEAGATYIAALKKVLDSHQAVTGENLINALYQLSGQTVGVSTISISAQAHDSIFGTADLRMYQVQDGKFALASKQPSAG